MREILERRLEELKAELEKGRKAAEDLEQQRAALQSQMLRIGGAVHVLEEILERPELKTPAGTPG